MMMHNRVGIRREDKYEWERRTPLVPVDLSRLVQTEGLDIVCQSSAQRAIGDAEFTQAGVPVEQDLTDCQVIFGVKEIPVERFEVGKTYVFFSHTIKGQPYNMPMLQRMLDLGCTLIDYETITDSDGQRLVFFGNYAGLAGMIETLWLLGQRFVRRGVRTPLLNIRRPIDYADLATAKADLAAIGEEIQRNGLPETLNPITIGIAGYGHVSKGAQEILDILPVREIDASRLAMVDQSERGANNLLCKVVFREEDMVEPLNGSQRFKLQEYYDHPERYHSVFKKYLPHLDALVNAIYWEERYPRLVTKEDIRKLYSEESPRLKTIGDISCDIGGAIECTVKPTTPHDPVYVYDPVEDLAVDGLEGDGLAIMAVEILPTELPRESSAFFSNSISPFVPAIASADYSASFDSCSLPEEIKRATIAYKGELTPKYRYIERFLEQQPNMKGEKYA